MEFREFDQPTNKTRRIETSNIPLNFTRGKIHSILSFVGLAAKNPATAIMATVHSDPPVGRLMVVRLYCCNRANVARSKVTRRFRHPTMQTRRVL